MILRTSWFYQWFHYTKVLYLTPDNFVKKDCNTKLGLSSLDTTLTTAYYSYESRTIRSLDSSKSIWSARLSVPTTLWYS